MFGLLLGLAAADRHKLADLHAALVGPALSLQVILWGHAASRAQIMQSLDGGVGA